MTTNLNIYPFYRYHDPDLSSFAYNWKDHYVDGRHDHVYRVNHRVPSMMANLFQVIVTDTMNYCHCLMVQLQPGKGRDSLRSDHVHSLVWNCIWNSEMI